MHHKLTDAQVAELLDLVDAGLSYSVIAEKFGVSKALVGHIVVGRRRALPLGTSPRPPVTPEQQREQRLAEATAAIDRQLHPAGLGAYLLGCSASSQSSACTAST